MALNTEPDGRTARTLGRHPEGGGARLTPNTVTIPGVGENIYPSPYLNHVRTVLSSGVVDCDFSFGGVEAEQHVSPSRKASPRYL